MSNRERVGTGGSLTVYDPLTALGGAVRDPGATASYYSGPARQSLSRAQAFLGKYAAPIAGGAALIPGAFTAAEEFGEGRLVGGAAALGGAALQGGLSALGTKLIGKGGIPGTVAGLGLMGLGMFAPQAAAQGAEYARQQATGVPTKGKEGDIASQLALQEKLGELGLSQFRTALGTETSNIKDLSKFVSDQAYLDFQRNLPLVNQMKNADLVRQQALLASQGNQLARLSVLGTAGQLATGAQAESGATLRTMLTSNPYANAVLR